MTEAKKRSAGAKTAGLPRQPLKYKVEGGLEKISSLYETLDKDPDAFDACWEKPHSFLKDFIDRKDIQLSQGYKKLADALSSIDLNDYIEGFNPDDIHKLATSEDPAIAKLRNAVCGTEATLEEILEAGVSDDFNNPSVTVVVVLMVVVTVTTTSGSDVSINPDTPTPSFKQQQVRQLTAHAQTVADQLGWYTKQ